MVRFILSGLSFAAATLFIASIFWVVQPRLSYYESIAIANLIITSTLCAVLYHDDSKTDPW